MAMIQGKSEDFLPPPPLFLGIQNMILGKKHRHTPEQIARICRRGEEEGRER
jgi:hypothetical protein